MRSAILAASCAATSWNGRPGSEMWSDVTPIGERQEQPERHDRTIQVMRGRFIHSWLLLAPLLLPACSARSAAQAGDAGQDQGDVAPVFTAAEKAQLASLAPAALPAPPADSSNRYADDARAALLGQKLFFDPLFSGALLNGDNDGSANTLGVKGQTGRVSCAGCHVPAAGFSDNRTLGTQLSLAAGWEDPHRRTPSLYDVGQSKLLMWDGRRDALYNQVFGPFESLNEMNSGRLFVAEQIVQRYAADYQAIFGALPDFSGSARFPPIDAAHTGCNGPAGSTPVCHGLPGDGAEYDGMAAADQDAVTRVVVNAGKALGAYQRLLSCGQSPFDAWVHGTGTLTNSEQRGAAVFIGKGQCLSCHSGPFFSDEKFHNVGLAPAAVSQDNFTDIDDQGAGTGIAAANADPLNTHGKYSDGDDGRLPDTAGPAAAGSFRTPKLRCASQRPSFMHTAQLRTLEDVVAFFNKGGLPFGYPGKSEIVPLNLTSGEMADLAAFLRSLQGTGAPASLLKAP